MSFIPTPNGIRVSVLGEVDSQLCVTTLWLLGTTPADITALENIGDAIISWQTTDILPLLSNGYSLNEVNCIAQDTSFAPSVTRVTGLPATGAVNSPTQAPQVAGVITFRTANRGRTARGRNYIPGIPENALSSPGEMGPTFRAAMISAYGDISTFLAGLNVGHVVVSHVLDKVPRSAGFPQDVTSYTMDAPLDTQRRRTVGRGV